MRRVLVTGASGFIGQATISALLQADFEIHAVSSRANESSSGLSWHRADLLESKQVAALLEQVRPSHLIHLAWYVEHSKYWYSIENLRWVQASLQLIQEFARQGGHRIVCAGTCAEYDWNYQRCSEVDTPVVPNSLYGASKAGLSLMAQQYAHNLDVEFCWARLFFPYGPAENRNRLIPQTVLSLLGDEIVTCNNPTYERDFILVEDVGKIISALTSSSATGFVNIGTGVPTTLGAFVTMVAAQIGKPDLVSPMENQVNGESSVLFADSKRLLSIIGDFPFTNLERGIERTIDWWRCRQ